MLEICFLLGLLDELFLATFGALKTNVLEVVYGIQDVLIAVVEGDFHNVDCVVSLQTGSILTLEHLLGWVLSLGNPCNLAKRHDDVWLAWVSFESHFVFVHEQTTAVQHDVALN